MLGLIQQGMTTRLLPALGNVLGKTKAPLSQRQKEVSALPVLARAHQHQTEQQSWPCVFQIMELGVVPTEGGRKKPNQPG